MRGGVDRDYFIDLPQLRGTLSTVPDDLLADVISSQTTILYGAPGVGKGRVLAELILSGIQGSDWAGKPWARQLSSVVIATTDAGGERDYVRYLDRAGLDVLDEDRIAFRLCQHDEDWGQLAQVVGIRRPGLFVIDNATEAVCGDLNAQHDVRKWLAPLEALRRQAVPVVLVGHTAKPSADTGGRRGQTPLGSTLWEAWARSKMLVRPAYRAEGADLTVEVRPRYSQPWTIQLANTEGYGGDRLSVVNTEREVERRQKWSRSARGRNEAVAAKVMSNCAGMTKTEVAGWVVANEPTVAKTLNAAKTALTRQRQWAALLTFDSDGKLVSG